MRVTFYEHPRGAPWRRPPACPPRGARAPASPAAGTAQQHMRPQKIKRKKAKGRGAVSAARGGAHVNSGGESAQRQHPRERPNSRAPRNTTRPKIRRAYACNSSSLHPARTQLVSYFSRLGTTLVPHWTKRQETGGDRRGRAPTREIGPTYCQQQRCTGPHVDERERGDGEGLGEERSGVSTVSNSGPRGTTGAIFCRGVPARTFSRSSVDSRACHCCNWDSVACRAFPPSSTDLVKAYRSEQGR